MTIEALSLVLGTLGIGSQSEQIAGYAPVTDDEAFAVMDAAWSLGIRIADTALSYGSGSALKRLTKWQVERGYGFEVVAKLGRPIINGKIQPDYCPRALQREFEVYLEHNTKVTTVLVKDPQAEDIRSGRWESSVERIKAIYPELRFGFSSHDLAACTEIPEPSHEAIVQIEANAMNWVLAEKPLNHLSSCGFKVWAMQPLAGGFLTGGLGERDGLHPADWRNAYSEATFNRKRAAAAQAVELLLTALPGVSVSTAAHAFLLSQPIIDRIVIGPRLLGHVDDVARALDLVSNGVDCVV